MVKHTEHLLGLGVTSARWMDTSLSHQVERGHGGSRLRTALMVPETRLLLQAIVSEA